MSKEEYKQEVLSYAGFVKQLDLMENKSTEDITSLVDRAKFLEDTSTTYNNLSVKVLYKQLPIVINDDLLVKVVVLIQGENIALVFPENVLDVFEIVKEYPNLLGEKNLGLSLYAEVRGFDSYSNGFRELVKTTYLNAGNYLKAFDLVGIDTVEKGEGGEDNQEKPFTPEGTLGEEDFSSFIEPPTEIREPVETFESVKENLHLFESFTSNLISFKNLINKLSENKSKLFRDNIKFKLIGKSVLIVEVNNREIYNSNINSKPIAKKVISKIGESIRKFKDTQLIDSFMEKGKRYFVLVENNTNNFWVVENEDIETAKISKTKEDLVKPINIIKLKSSSIRTESRNYIPYLHEGDIVFKTAILTKDK